MAAPAEVQELDRVSSAVDSLEVSQKDAQLASKILEMQKTLIEVRREMQGTDPEKYPFNTLVLNVCAKDVANAALTVESKLNSFMIQLLQCKKIADTSKGVHTFTQEEKDTLYDQMAVFRAWNQNMRNLHESHCQVFSQFIDEFIQYDPSRTPAIQQAIIKRMKCPTHEQPAIAKSLDGKSLQCALCFQKEPVAQPGIVEV